METLRKLEKALCSGHSAEPLASDLLYSAETMIRGNVENEFLPEETFEKYFTNGE